jgi:hypothetical protein
VFIPKRNKMKNTSLLCIMFLLVQLSYAQNINRPVNASIPVYPNRTNSYIIVGDNQNSAVEFKSYILKFEGAHPDYVFQIQYKNADGVMVTYVPGIPVIADGQLHEIYISVERYQNLLLVQQAGVSIAPPAPSPTAKSGNTTSSGATNGAGASYGTLSSSAATNGAGANNSNATATTAATDVSSSGDKPVSSQTPSDASASSVNNPSASDNHSLNGQQTNAAASPTQATNNNPSAPSVSIGRMLWFGYETVFNGKVFN